MTKTNDLSIKTNYGNEVKEERNILRSASQFKLYICCNFKYIWNKIRKKNLRFIYPYVNTKNYLEKIKDNGDYEEQWEKVMITPYWNGINGKDHSFCYFYKPNAIKNIDIIEKQIQCFSKIDLSSYEKDFEDIAKELPRELRRKTAVAFYPMYSEDLIEGVAGYCCPNSGNILIQINPLINNYYEWISFVFAHEYHHNSLFYYWYNIKEGRETKGNLLENIINEGQADEFAKSLFKGYEPSWQKGVLPADEEKAWELFKNVIYESMSQDEMVKYMFGSKKDGIPYCAGYYFGGKIVRGFMDKNPHITFKEMIKIPHQIIFNEGCNW